MKVADDKQWAEIETNRDAALKYAETFRISNGIDSLKAFCERQIEERYIQPIRYIKKGKAVKRKRALVALAAATALGGIIVMGVNYLYKMFMKPDQETIIKELEKGIATDEKLVTVIKKQKEQLANVTQYLGSDFNDTVLSTIVAIQTAEMVYIASRQLEILRHLNKSIESDIIEPEFFNWFKINLNCSSNCPLSGLTNLNVSVANYARIPVLNLNFDISVEDDTKEINSADWFRLVTHNGTHICDKVYDGPKFMLIDKVTREFCKIHEEDLTKYQAPVKTKSNCLSSSTQTSNSWKLRGCISAPINATVVTHDIQVKLYDTNYAIYCAGHTLTIYNMVIPCPNKVLLVPKYTNFSINDNHYTSETIKYTVQAPAASDWTQAINLRLMASALKMPTMEDIDFEVIDKLIAERKSIVEQIKDEWHIYIPRFLMIPLLVAIIILISVIACRLIPSKRTVTTIVKEERTTTRNTDYSQIPLHKCY